MSGRAGAFLATAAFLTFGVMNALIGWNMLGERGTRNRELLRERRDAMRNQRADDGK